MNCIICLEEPGRKRLTCPNCEVIACIPCIQTHLTSAEEVRCPSCTALWSQAFLAANLSKSFMRTKFAAWRRDILWAREQAHMSDAAAELERRRTLAISILPLESRRAELMAELNELNHKIQYLNDTSTANKTFIRRCPLDCRGFIDTSWHCATCDRDVCADCLGHKSGDHVCAEDEKNTVTTINADSKPCPKCGIVIQRLSGCASMYCVQCKTAFNWNTLKIQEGGIIDNPHYVEEIRDVEDPDIIVDMRVLRPLINWSRATTDNLHYGREETTEYRLAARFLSRLRSEAREAARLYSDHLAPPSHLEYRIAFLDGRISEEQFRRHLVNSERRTERHRAIRQIYDAYIAAANGLFRRFAEIGTEAARKIMPDYANTWRDSILIRAFWISNTSQAKLIHDAWIKEWRAIEPEFQPILNQANTAFADLSRTLDFKPLVLALPTLSSSH